MSDLVWCFPSFLLFFMENFLTHSSKEFYFMENPKRIWTFHQITHFCFQLLIKVSYVFNYFPTVLSNGHLVFHLFVCSILFSLKSFGVELYPVYPFACCWPWFLVEDALNIRFWLFRCRIDSQCLHRGIIIFLLSFFVFCYFSIVGIDFIFPLILKFLYDFLCFYSSRIVALALLGLLQQGTASCWQPVKHTRLFLRVLTFLLMCLHHALPLRSRWHWDGDPFLLNYYMFDGQF